MKRLSSPAFFLLLAISAVLVASSAVIFAATAVDGRLLIKRSPVMGDNVAITVKIDGKPAGVVRRGQAYEHYLTPGRHELTVSPNALGGRWSTTLEVRAGETFSYVVSYHVDKLVLTRVTTSR